MFLAVVFHSAIRFMILKKMNTKVVIFELQQVYGSDSASERIVYGWGAQFKHGRTGVFDEKKTENALINQPKLVKTQEKH